MYVYSINKENKTIDARNIIYPSIDNNMIFDFIDEVRSTTVNNAIVPFEDFADIESYLLQQWAGMMYSFLTRENENARMADTLAMMKEMNERIEILSRQILRSVGTTETKITAELYDAIISIAGADFLRVGNRNLSPKLILENENLQSCISALGFKYYFEDDSDTLMYSDHRCAGSLDYQLYSNQYGRIREELINILKKQNITIKEYISM